MFSLKVENISKNFGKIKALDNVSLNAPLNSIFGIIGPDGAGKSTLFRISTTLLLSDSGKCFVNGLDSKKDFMQIRQIVGYMPGNFSLYMDLSVEENLNFFAGVYGIDIKENYNLIKVIYEQLRPFKNRRAKALSGGMKQKLALCCTLIHKPKILFLDEPTTGVDAVSRKEFWEILQELKKHMSIIVCTPYMDEASICDEIALMHEGQVLSTNSPSKLCKQYPRKLFKLSNVPVNTLSELRVLPYVQSCYLFANSFHISFKDENFNINEFLKKYKGALLEPINANVEDCFMEFLR
ncbi:ABC transporter ATP-binding protein [Campylobacter sp. LR264d]|uniref:ABC transporter ATP-binding protein n=1 Tax=Campylobacter sp. LR264d TaxID=2593544 RepID=UPI00123A22E6|nr:ABC transporter ATP-binding protein [Campylobacter sp. LR264d]KAA6231103.1 ABC transporter ATP-binding protein [Campylobacter sp. LR264d]